MNTLFIALLASVIGPGVLAILLGWQRSKEKRQDYERQDAVAAAAVEVAAEAKRQQDEVAAQAAKAAKLLADQQAETAKQAERVAQLLLAAQEKTTLATDEVARKASVIEGQTISSQVVITLAYPNGNRTEVFLSEVPRVGENIRLSNGAEEPWLVVEHVLWVEGTRPPHVIVSVHPLIERST